MKKIVSLLSSFPMFIVLAFPASTNYRLDAFEFGGGGGTGSSTGYSFEGIAGETGGNAGNSTTYGANTGLMLVQQANVPPAPTFVNSSSWYNKLKITINKDSGDPTDATYAIAISDDNWVTTEWVQNDNTVGATLGSEDFQTYANWGGASGEFIIGLTPNTTYKVKVTASQGKYTQSPLGPEASAATSQVSISFDLDVSSIDEETAAPYSVSFGDLSAGSVTTATNKVWIDLTTNAESGGYIYISGVNSGLKSTVLNYTISAVSADLSVSSEGFGIQSSSSTESAGGPLIELTPYDGTSQNVGIVNTTIRELYSTSGNPITSGRGSFVLKTKISSSTPAADDYAETFTIITSATF
ncbi:MAG: hypothetical protein UZ22_OP11002000872 [Microgenomates bacterium OLB23]|nr:MAG: hypothetical protein UZ22_OP11002000872 [Microgenomates bacterium OLB23]